MFIKTDKLGKNTNEYANINSGIKASKFHNLSENTFTGVEKRFVYLTSSRKVLDLFFFFGSKN